MRDYFVSELEIPVAAIEDMEPEPFERGAYGAVHRATYDGNAAAVKVVNLAPFPKAMRANIVSDVMKEIAVQASLRSAYTVDVFGASTKNDQGKLMIVMELASAGSLRAYLDRHVKTKPPLTAERCLDLLLDALGTGCGATGTVTARQDSAESTFLDWTLCFAQL